MAQSNSSSELPRLSRKELVILELLVSKVEMYGLEMVKKSKGSLKRGSIYVLLSRMAEKGYVDSREEPRVYPEIGIPRRKYCLLYTSPSPRDKRQRQSRMPSSA